MEWLAGLAYMLSWAFVGTCAAWFGVCLASKEDHINIFFRTVFCVLGGVFASLFGSWCFEHVPLSYGWKQVIGAIAFTGGGVFGLLSKVAVDSSRVRFRFHYREQKNK